MAFLCGPPPSLWAPPRTKKSAVGAMHKVWYVEIVGGDMRTPTPTASRWPIFRCLLLSRFKRSPEVLGFPIILPFWQALPSLWVIAAKITIPIFVPSTLAKNKVIWLCQLVA